MITTKAISAKIDADLLQELDEECRLYGGTRNRRINNAIRLHLDNEDKERYRAYHASCGTMGDDGAALTLGKYILENLTGEEHAHIKFSAKGIGCSPEHLMHRLIVGALEDFKKRPFSYL